MHHRTIRIRTNKMQKILVIRLYFLLDALHVSDYSSPSSGAAFISCKSRLVYADTIRLAVVAAIVITCPAGQNTYLCHCRYELPISTCHILTLKEIDINTVF